MQYVKSKSKFKYMKLYLRERMRRRNPFLRKKGDSTESSKNPFDEIDEEEDDEEEEQDESRSKTNKGKHAKSARNKRRAPNAPKKAEEAKKQEQEQEDEEDPGGELPEWLSELSEDLEVSGASWKDSVVGWGDTSLAEHFGNWEKWLLFHFLEEFEVSLGQRQYFFVLLNLKSPMPCYMSKF